MDPVAGRFVSVSRIFSRSGFCLLVCIILCTAPLYHPVNASTVQVVESGQSRLSFSLDDVVVQWRQKDLRDGSVVLFDPFVAGLTTSGEPGGVRTPRKGGWLLLPPGTSARVEKRQENWSATGAMPLMVQPVPVLVQGDQPDFITTSEILVLPGEGIPDDAPVPAAVRAEYAASRLNPSAQGLVLGEATWWRGHRIVPWRLNLVRHDGRVATDALESGRWEIVFEADKKTTGSIPAGHDMKNVTRGDDRFSGLFLNANLLESLPTEARFQGIDPSRSNLKRADKKGDLIGSMEARILVNATNFYRVTYEQLSDRGYLPAGPIQESEMRLYQRRYLERLDDGSGDIPYAEIEVPIHMVGEGDEFSGDDFFIFYGLRPRDDTDFIADLGEGPESLFGCGDNFEMNNESNVYWVAASTPDAGDEWARMEYQSLPAASTPALTSYRRSEHFEDNVVYRENPEDVNMDRLYLDSYNSEEVSVHFSPLWSPNPIGDDLEIEVQLSSRLLGPQTLNFDLITDDSLVTSLGLFTVEGTDLMEWNHSTGAEALDGTNSKLRITHESGGDVESWINWVNLSYDAHFVAVGNRLTFHGSIDPGNQPMEVAGFTSQDIGLIEITDPRNPVFIPLGSENLVADGDNWIVSIEPVHDSGLRHFAALGNFSTDGILEFNYYDSSVADNQISPLELSGSDPDLLVVTHPEFTETLDRWIEHRKQRAGGDLEVHTVEVQDIFDWYSGGMKDPWAIKRLANHAISQWGSWSLVLVGDANENVRELGVLLQARGFSKDWVPTHFHVQDVGSASFKPEVLASDKWYATFEAGMDYPVEDFPAAIFSPWQMYVGRFPCNSIEDLNTIIDKIMVVENVQPDQTWRKRAIFMADDAWSNGYGGQVTTLTYRSWEEDFVDVERDLMAPGWRGATPITLEADTLFLDNYLHPVWVAQGSPAERSSQYYQNAVEDGNALTDLLVAFNRGGLINHYQGHANSYVLCSEFWIQDRDQYGYRKDVQNFSNANSPWFFMGMGCHISDWAQDTVTVGIYPNAPSLGEKFLTHSGGGASATFGSSGFEYISPNRNFGEYIMRRWVERPPNSRLVPEGSGSNPHRSRWMLGELMWYSEADVLADFIGSTSREMVAQYTLLGDPLMTLDAGEPEVQAVLVGDPDQEIVGEVDLYSGNVENLRVVNIEARDEAGISRIRVTDSTGADLTESVVTESLPEGEVDHQEVHYQLDLPIRPFDHQIRVEVFDTGGILDSDRHYSLMLNIIQEAVFTADGEVVDPAAFTFTPEEPVNFQCTMASGAWLHDGMEFEVIGDNLDISNVVIDASKTNSLDFSFTAVASPGTSGDRGVIFSINGFETTWLLEDDGAILPDATISKVLNYPNPMRDNTRFVFETSASTGDGTVRVFAVSGRTVANIPFSYSGGHEGIISWDGRDDDGDSLANGTYLYRVEMNTPAGVLVSPMQRLVVMN